MLSSPSPLKTALASEVFLWPNESSLAVPSDNRLRTGASGDQRVKEQVMMTVRRQKPKNSQSSTLNYGTRAGSMYETLEDSYNINRNSTGGHYAKYQSGTTWGYQPQYNGTLKKENKRFSSQSQFDNWGRQQYISLASPISPGNDYNYMQTLKSSRSEPDLTGPNMRGTLRRQNLYNAQNQYSQQQRSGRGGVHNSSFYSHQSGQQWKQTSVPPTRTPSSISATHRQTQQQFQNTLQRNENYAGMQLPSRMDSRDDFDGTPMTIERAVELLEGPNEKYQTSGANYIQHTCYQDESAKSLVNQYHGIQKLISLFRSSNQNVQLAAAGALRNLVFKNNQNKLETSRQGGVREAVSLLRKTPNQEIQKQITGLLWNLSSTDQLKDELVKEALAVLNECVVVPYTGWAENTVSGQRISLDPEIFFNATGCL
ncbi:plakophilin-1-like, partial [Bufo gargarizans]|uniref:plakophilin-1-like n=1 Tax=Bufo gargarizans TaxID=30331 RepID=UPI001CF229F9